MEELPKTSRWPILAAILVCCGDDHWGHGLYVQEEGLTKTCCSLYTVQGSYQNPSHTVHHLRVLPNPSAHGPHEYLIQSWDLTQIPHCQKTHTVKSSLWNIRGLTRTPPHPGLTNEHDNIPSKDRALPNPCRVNEKWTNLNQNCFLIVHNCQPSHMRLQTWILIRAQSNHIHYAEIPELSNFQCLSLFSDML